MVTKFIELTVPWQPVMITQKLSAMRNLTMEESS